MVTKGDHAAMSSLPELSQQFPRVLDRVSIAIVVKIRPHALRATLFDALRPDREFFRRVIMPIPPLRPVKADVDVVGGFDQLVRETRAARGAENRAGLAERIVHTLVPPAAVSKLNDVAPQMNQ